MKMTATSPSVSDFLPFIAIGNPESPRAVAFAGAVLERCGALPKLVEWAGVIAERTDWGTLCQGTAVVRIDSPGRNSAVEKGLLTLGANAVDEDDPLAGRWTRWPAEVCSALPEDRGRIVPSRQWFLGFRQALQRVRDGMCKGHSSPRWFNAPNHIECMFDKASCSQILHTSGCRVPPLLGIPSGFDELMEMMRATGRQRVFLKLCHGSSASGAVALECSGQRVQAFSTAVMDGRDDFGRMRLYNARKVTRYHSLPEVRQLIDILCAERVIAEAWVPKAGLHGRRFDMRVVVIAGRARHLVVRLADGPFTNLQLGAKRAGVAELRAHFGDAMIHAVKSAAEMAVQPFPGCLYAGVDVVWGAVDHVATVLEVNAFGDLLPGVRDDGEDTYMAEVNAMLRRLAEAG